MSTNEGDAKKAEQQYREAQQKLAQSHPPFVAKMVSLYNVRV